MKNIFYSLIFLTLFLQIESFAQETNFFQKIAGNWEGTLEYLDYSENKRVKLKTYLTITPSADGKSAQFMTVYDDFGRIIKDTETVTLDLAARKYLAGKSEYEIYSLENDKLILLGSGQDGEKVEPIRETISFDANSLIFLKETRMPWQFRNQLSLKNSAENVLAKRTLSASQMNADFDILRKTLTGIHPGVYRYQTPETLTNIFEDFQKKLENPLSENDFFILVAQLTNRLGCGHTFINPYNLDAVTRERVFGGKNYLPFYFQITGGKMIITKNASPENIAKGSEIKKINGVAAEKILEKLLTVTKADGANTFAHRVESLSLPRFEAERYALFDMYYPIFFPVKDETFKVEINDFAAKKLIELTVPALTKDARSAEMKKRYGASPTYDDGWEFKIQNDSIAYLRINNSITWRLKNIKFKEFLAESFAQIKTKNIKNLIIDLRENGGGDMTIGYELSKYLTNRELAPYADSVRLIRTVSAKPELAKYLDTYSKELKSALQNGVPQNFYKQNGDGFYEILPTADTETFPKVTPYENAFSGTAYIIADSAAASATFQFLNYAQENKLATIVGQTSGGNKQGINGGNYFFLNLPNSKAEIDIPVYFQAPLSAQKDEGIVPDIPVTRLPTDIGNNIDREMLAIKNLIRKK